MKRLVLGSTGIMVSRLCYGTLTIGPLQRNMTALEGGRLLIYALQRGINFFDTAEIYGNYSHLRVLLDECPGAVIATKTYAYDNQTAEQSFRKAVEGLGREYIDLFLLHEQESVHTIRGHYEALEYLLKRRDEGFIGAVGISTHNVAAARAALKYPEIAVVHTIINKRGIGIADGSREDMEQAISALHADGRGVYAMKALGGGHLIAERKSALAYVLALPGLQSVAVGMQSLAEIDYNTAVFEGIAPADALEIEIGRTKRSLIIHDWCRGCGRCISVCKHGALRLHEGKSAVDQNRCVRCGYCAAVCPDFCIKVL